MVRALWSRVLLGVRSSMDPVCTSTRTSASCLLVKTRHMLVATASGLSPSVYTSHLHINTSGLEPSLPSLKHTFMLNCTRNLAHLACRCKSFLEDMKYSKFLWSVTVSITLAEPSRKCHQFLNALNTANSSLLWVS